MRFLKAGLIGLVVLSVILTLMSLLFPSTIKVTRAADIYAPKEKVAEIVLAASGWPEWYLPLYQDSLHHWKPEGNSFKEKNNVLRIEKLNDSTASVYASSGSELLEGHITLFGSPGQEYCTVYWEMYDELKWYPWEKFGSLLSEKIIGQAMDASLAQLKGKMESR